MRTVLLLLGISLMAALPAHAGRNAHGALIVHTGDYTFTADLCDEDYDDPGTCEDAVTRTDNDEDMPVLIWLIAAFPEPAIPSVTTIYFGHDHNLPEGSHHAWGVCGPTGTRDWPSPLWPDAPATSGNVVDFRTPITGDRLFLFYWVIVSGFEGAYYGTAIHPAYGFASFDDDGSPPVRDPVERFGRVRWYGPGYNECPLAPPVGACCFITGECLLHADVLCAAMEGEFQGEESVCDPNPCLTYPGACCYDDGHCEILEGIDCLEAGGEWQAWEADCDPNPCPQREGACCYMDGSCEVKIESRCWGWEWVVYEACDPNPCTAVQGACCICDYVNREAECIFVTEQECNETPNAEVWYGPWQECEYGMCVWDCFSPVEANTWGKIKATYR